MKPYRRCGLCGDKSPGWSHMMLRHPHARSQHNLVIDEGLHAALLFVDQTRSQLWLDDDDELVKTIHAAAEGQQISRDTERALELILRWGKLPERATPEGVPDQDSPRGLFG